MQFWYQRSMPGLLLLPLSGLFWCITLLRRMCYRTGVFNVTKVDVPVIVVGNLSVGGNGKTPVVLALADYLSRRGYRPGILSRGYGGGQSEFPHQVSPTDSAAQVGDEPCLMASRNYAPVVIDPKRARGAQYLIEHCNCDIIICDDGLQHYALARDIELVVMDERKLGNGFLLPAGPLRETRRRLQHITAVIHNTSVPLQEARLSNTRVPQFAMSLAPGDLTQVRNSKERRSISEIESPVSALAGIGNPERFFRQLDALGVSVNSKIPFADHYEFSGKDIPEGVVIMTEKDAVKVRAFAHQQCWFLPVDAEFSDGFFPFLEQQLQAVTAIKGNNNGV